MKKKYIIPKITFEEIEEWGGGNLCRVGKYNSDSA